MDTADTARTAPAHTPGPWYVSHTAGHDIHGQSAITHEATGRDIAIVYDGEANARLIAAAPDMLAALESIAECGDSGSRHVARAAIAQARGDAR